MWCEYSAAGGIPSGEARDGEGMYANWPVKGASAYTGGLVVAALEAGAGMAAVLVSRTDGGESEKVRLTETVDKYTKMASKARETYSAKLWNGTYVRRHEGSNSIQADQLHGDWQARATGLPGVVDESKALLAMESVYNSCVMEYQAGKRGAVNGMEPVVGGNHRVDQSSPEAGEVWPGVTYTVAAQLIELGMLTEAFCTAQGVYDTSMELGYQFATPAAWDEQGRFRGLSDSKGMAIWAMHHSLQRHFAGGKQSPQRLQVTAEITDTPQLQGSLEELEESLEEDFAAVESR